jgi:hypothetical protein
MVLRQLQQEPEVNLALQLARTYRPLRRSHFLFLGYSVRNWNLRIILRRLWGEQRLSYKSWAVQSTLPDSMERGLWRDQGVDVLDVRLDHYLDGLGKRCEAEMRTLL